MPETDPDSITVEIRDETGDVVGGFSIEYLLSASGTKHEDGRTSADVEAALAAKANGEHVDSPYCWCDPLTSGPEHKPTGRS